MFTEKESSELSVLTQKLFESMQAVDRQSAKNKATIASIQARQKLVSYSVFYTQTIQGKKSKVQKLARSLKSQGFFIMEIYEDSYDASFQPIAYGITYFLLFDAQAGLKEAPSQYVNEYFDSFNLCD